MAITHVQGAHNASSTASTTLAITFGSAVKAGGAVAGGFTFDTGVTLTSITDDKGNTYNTETVLVDGVSGQQSTAFSRGNINNGPTVITATISAAVAFLSMVGDEYSGILAASDPRDVHGGQIQDGIAHPLPGTGTDGISSGSFTTTSNGDLIYGVTIDTSSTILATAGTGYTSETTSNVASTPPMLSEDKVQAAAGSVAATFTQSANADAVTFLIALKAAPAGGIAFDQHLPRLNRPYRQGPKAGLFQVKAFPSVAVAAPFRQTDWLLPQAVELYPYRSFEWNNRKLLTGQDALPFRQRDWPLSVNPEPDPRRSWALSLLQTTLTPVVVLPFRQTDWPLPQALEPDPRRSWTWSYNLNLLGQDQFPFRQSDWPLPERGVEPDARRSWTLSLLQTTLTPVIVIPFRQTDWPLPVAAEPNPQRSWASSYTLSLIGQDALPFRQMDWPNPLPASPWQMAPVLPNLTLILPPFIPPVSQPFQQITSLGGIFNPGSNAIG